MTERGTAVWGLEILIWCTKESLIRVRMVSVKVGRNTRPKHQNRVIPTNPFTGVETGARGV